MAVKEIEKTSRIGEDEFERMSRILFITFNFDQNKSDVGNLEKKEEFIHHFSDFLKKFLDLQFQDSKKNKLEIINFIDKLNLERELLEIERGKKTLADFMKAGKNLGKKSQSAFKTR